MTLDLSYARTIAEQYMVDRCTVYRDPEGSTDDTIDPNTGRVIPDPPTVVYSGPCLCGKSSQRVNQAKEGQDQVYRRVRRFRFPVSAPRFRLRDTIVMETSPDPNANAQLVGQRFRVFDPDDRSLAASRIVLAEDDTGGRSR